MDGLSNQNGPKTAIFYFRQFDYPATTTTAGLTGRTTAVTATAGLTEQNDSRDKYRVMTRTSQRRGQAHGRTESRTTAVTVLLIRSKHDKGKAHEMHTHEEDVNQ